MTILFVKDKFFFASCLQLQVLATRQTKTNSGQVCLSLAEFAFTTFTKPLIHIVFENPRSNSHINGTHINVAVTLNLNLATEFGTVREASMDNASVPRASSFTSSLAHRSRSGSRFDLSSQRKFYWDMNL